MRWDKKFDGNKDSLRKTPHTPLSPHLNAHTPLEIKSIRDYMRRNPHISLPELYGNSIFIKRIAATGTIPQKFYQYTVIDEASRERFIFPYLEQSSYSTVDFMKRAFTYFGYQPSIVQTDNGSEFTHIKKTDRVHPLAMFLQPLGITHQRIRSRTPRHNGKVERSH